MATNKMTGKEELGEAYASGSLVSYLKKKAVNHNHYKHYPTDRTITRIIQDGSLLLNRGDNWNDDDDRSSFRSLTPDGYVRFAMCFSFSASESVAMWMLYGGRNKRGAMVDFTRSTMNGILDEVSSLEIGRLTVKGFEVSEIVHEPNFELFLQDVIYCGKSDDTGLYTIKRSDHRVDGLEPRPFEIGLVEKKYPWSYENEVRLIAQVKEDKLGHGQADYALIRYDGIGSCNRCYSSPDYEGDEDFRRSTLKGSINWDLCKGCSHRRNP